MKASQFFISTLKEAPADAEVVSHKLMTRAGLIKKLGAGIYNYMPLGLRVIRKVEAIVREEMNRAGAVELTMPVVQPAELWQETGRFENMGPELLRIQDRHGRDFVVQPTSEEVITDIARQELKSYKQLPKNFYQIQTKFRDERRPRFGLMRGREFIMKDAYSFDRDQAAAKASYQVMAQAYRRIFDRFGLTYRAVAADSGAIGGDLSEEFQVIAATGEDAIVYCPQSDYAANNGNPAAPELGEGPATVAQTQTALFKWPVTDLHNGVCHMRSEVNMKHITDGTSNTYMVGEKYQRVESYGGSFAPGSETYDLGDNESMFSGHNRDQHRSTNQLFPPHQDRPGVQDDYAFGSSHPSAFGMAMCDASVRWVSFDIDPVMHERYGVINDGETVTQQ